MKRSLILITAISLLITLPCAVWAMGKEDSFKAGAVKFDKGDYAEAIKERAVRTCRTQLLTLINRA